MSDPAPSLPVTAPRLPTIFGVLIFGFGVAAGVLVAFSGTGLEESAGLIISVFLVLIVCLLVLAAMIFAFRKPIWRRLFGVVETELERVATPALTAAERIAERDGAGAMAALREVLSVVVARYAWLTTRRWVIASLTGLIAAMAALAGTALLFRQNQLIEVQSELLREQNARVAEQTLLLGQDVQLAEAARNAALAVEITDIAAELGRIAATTTAAGEAATGQIATGPFNAMTTDDIGRELVLRITSVSRATKPYRFLDLGVRAQTQRDKLRAAVDRRRDELPNTYARLANYNGWVEPDTLAQLIDRPASPERGQLLSVLLQAGLYNLETLNFAGLDLSHAHMPNATVVYLTAQGGLLDSADFTGSYLTEVDLGGAALENARFRGTVIHRSRFAAIDVAAVRTPYTAEMAPLSTRANGVDFAGAAIWDTTFAGAQLIAANFDASLLVGADFGGASPALATFRGAILVAPVWDGANLRSTDFDGAVMFGADPLADIAAVALEGTFVASRFRADPIAVDSLSGRALVDEQIDLSEVVARTGGAQAWRITRIQPFDDGSPP